MANINLYSNFNKKYGCAELTEKIKGSVKHLLCVYCNREMFPKQILFRTIRNNGVTVYNFVGKDGYDSFIQSGPYILCKVCFSCVVKEQEEREEQEQEKNSIDGIKLDGFDAGIDIDMDDLDIIDMTNMTGINVLNNLDNLDNLIELDEIGDVCNLNELNELNDLDDLDDLDNLYESIDLENLRSLDDLETF